VLATHRDGGKIFSNVVSFSDGVYSQSNRQNSTGVPYFYLTTMDETARDLEKDPSASFSVSEKSADVDGRCGALDAQEPPCARIALMGQVVKVKSKGEVDFAKNALFSKHPAMEHWPGGHQFVFYKFDISEIFFLNEYGGPTPVRVRDYLSARLKDDEQEQIEAYYAASASINRRRLLRRHNAQRSLLI
jgi:Pyridoxamine 5'-phosphate oxidase